MWTTVYVASDKKSTDNIKKILTYEGIYVKVNDVSKEAGETSYAILVLENEAEDAKEILVENRII